MKYIKYFEDTKYTTEDILKTIYNIKNYTINEDGTVDVDGDVFLDGKGLTKIPVRFRKVTGSFYCNDNNLKTLEGSPIEVGGNFSCRNNKLTSLIGGPEEVIGDYLCYRNQLNSLEGAPAEVGCNFDCTSNQLKTLDFSTNIGGDLQYGNNLMDENTDFEKLNFYGHVKGEIVSWS